MAVPATLLLLGVVMSAQVTTIQVSPPQATQPRDPTVKPAVGTGSMPDGTFVIRNVPPGSYEPTATYMTPRPPPSPGVQGPPPMDNAEMATVRVDVGMADIENIRMWSCWSS